MEHNGINLLSFSKMIETGLENKSRMKTEFFPGSIHAEKVRDFWKKDLKAVEWVMNTLKEEYVITFIERPPAYEEPNNSSAIRDMDCLPGS